MSAGNVGWAKEIAAAAKSTPAFTHKTLSPKRLTAYIDISKQFLAQDSKGAEAMIRMDLINALNAKLEETILGAGDGKVGGEGADANDVIAPVGILNNKAAVSITDYAKLCEFEAVPQEANIVGNFKYILSPKAKAALRAMSKSTKNTQLVMEGGTVDGTPAFTTTHLANKDVIFGAFENLTIGSWGGINNKNCCYYN